MWTAGGGGGVAGMWKLGPLTAYPEHAVELGLFQTSRREAKTELRPADQNGYNTSASRHHDHTSWKCTVWYRGKSHAWLFMLTNRTSMLPLYKRVRTTRWKWAMNGMPVQLHKKVAKYKTSDMIRAEYEHELPIWIVNSWLIPYPQEQLRPPNGLIPLMIVIQPSKGKVHPNNELQGAK